MEVEIVNKLIDKKQTISSMESCTGGFFANTITNVDGSSNVFKYSAVTYSNEYKIKMGVKKQTIDKYSVYSFEVSREMAKCISDYSNSDYGIGITGMINRFDEFNPGGVKNEIYTTIYIRKSGKYIDEKIIVPNLARQECKKHIVNKVLSVLNGII